MVNIWLIIDIVLKLILAALCGGLIGIIKGNYKDSINLSVLILTCFTASLLIILFSKLNTSMNAGFNTFDLGLATVIIGFAIICSALIIIQKAILQSIINALTIWAVAGIGILIGLGNFVIGIIGGMLLSILLNLIQKLFIEKSNQDIY